MLLLLSRRFQKGGNVVKNNRLILGVLVIAILFVSGGAIFAAVNYPTRPVELVIPQGAGGGFDLSARAFISVAPDYFGRPVVITIRAGGGTVIGTHEVVRDRGDGHKLLYAGNHLLALNEFAGGIPFDPVADLKPVSRILNWPWVLVVHPDSPWHTMEEFLADAAENPGSIIMANAGALTIAQIPAFEVEVYGDVEFTHIPYDGGGPANQSVIQGDADAVFAVTGWAVSAVEQGLVRALAVTGQQRYPHLMDVPTLREFGIPSDTTLWAGIYAPKGTSDEIVNKIDEFVRQIMENETYIEMMTNLGNIIEYLGPADFAASIDRAVEAIKVVAEALE